MQQYHRIKAQYPGALLLFRVGDFYETFEEDAHTLHKITEIKLTKRSNGAAAAVALAGFPHHALDIYLPKLVRAGLRVAIADQTEPPKKGKEIVNREVSELVTPGITYHDELLLKKQNNYLASIHFEKRDQLGIALIDISTGEFLTTQGSPEHITKLITNFRPAEIIFNKKEANTFNQLFKDQYHHYMLEDWVYTTAYGYKRLNEHFNTKTLKGFGIEKLPNGIIAAGAILRYLEETEHHHLQHITNISRIEEEKYMWLDKFTIRNLELLQPQQEEGVSLIQILDKTVTPMGARRLKKWILLPLKEVNTINKRIEMVDILLKHPTITTQIHHHLKQIGDLERLISKVASKRINPRELQTLKKALEHTQPIQKLLKESKLDPLVQLQKQLHPCQYIIEKITSILQENPPIQSNQGGLIQPGISTSLDKWRKIAFQSNLYLQQIQQEERQKTGISSLKIGYNKIFGYYLEVTHTHKNKVPPTWIRKQTLVNAERYITEKLKEYEEKILQAQEQINIEEQQIYQQLVENTTHFVPQIQQNAKILSYIDCYHSFAQIAREYKYIRPKINEDHTIDIQAGRHPVIERTLPIGQTYTPNHTLLSEKEQILLITGPNMAGKSALLRQVALIVLMAQVGSFVPATQATIGIVDKIFTRVGASDNIARQESTFMVEMNEMASILNNLSKRSLIIVDEIGRGTGTADGLAIAQSIITYLHNHPKYQPKTLFATHYHQLNTLEKQLPKMKNYKVTVREIDNQIHFLHKLEQGSSQNSFGIQVAQMAGIPLPIIKNALRLITPLQKSQEKKFPLFPSPSITKKQHNTTQPQIESPLITTLKKVDINTLSPIEALLKLQELCKLLTKEQ